MRKLTIRDKENGELAMRSLSKKAELMYSNTDPLTIAEYEEDGRKLYAMRGCLGDKEGMTFAELQEDLEAFADEMIRGERYEDTEGEWEVLSVNGDKVTCRCIQTGNPNYGRDDFVVDFVDAWNHIHRR